MGRASSLSARARRPAAGRGVACAAIVALVSAFASAAAAGCSPPVPDPPPALEGSDAPRQTKPKPPPETSTETEVKKADAGTADSGSTCETVPPNHKCGLDPQCGCLENETCDVSSRTTGATSCVTAGTATLGRPCQQTGECLPGLACVYGACRPYCSEPLAKCAVSGTELCVTMDDDAGKPLPNMSFCTIRCDPREPSGVCGVNSCHWFATLYAPNKVSDCNFAGSKGALQACTDHADCKPGLACIEHPRHGRECERWCRIGVAGDCGPSTAFKCKDVYGANAPVINGVKEGICQDD